MADENGHHVMTQIDGLINRFEKQQNKYNESKDDNTTQEKQHHNIDLSQISFLWQNGVLNVSDVKEIKTILVNNKHSHLISSVLLKFIDFVQQIDGEKKQIDDEDIDKYIPFDDNIRDFQSNVRPLIQNAIKLSYSVPNNVVNNAQNAILYSILSQIDDNKLLSIDIKHWIKYKILSLSNDQIQKKIINFEDNNDKTMTFQQLYDVITCNNKQNVDKDLFEIIECSLNEEIKIYKECMEILNDEINIIKSIFCTEDDDIIVDTETFPVIIEICLCSGSKNTKLIKLYMTFLCPLLYPLKSSIKASIYFSGPNSFASIDEIWNLQFKLQQISNNSIGEQHLFEIIQSAKEWMEEHQTKYDYEQKLNMQCINLKHKYHELRRALGLNDGNINIEPENTKNKYIITTADSTIYLGAPGDGIQQTILIKHKTQSAQNAKYEADCYEAYEIDATIQELIKNSSLQWNCSKSEAKHRLQTNLWTSELSIDTQLEQMRNKHIINNNNNIDDMYDIKLNTLNPTTSDIEQDIYLEFPSIKQFECPICLEINSIFNGIRIHCQHSICISCLSEYIYNQIKNGKTMIKCPKWKCNQLIDNSLIHVLSDNISYIRYRQFIQNSFLEICDGWKYCPNPKCNSAIKTKSKYKGNVPLLVCNCSTPLCTQCMQKFHWPLKCKDNKLYSQKTKLKIKNLDPNLPNLPKFEMTIVHMQIDSRPCPKCKTLWEKISGCNHIHCTKCKCHFCWQCLKPFEPGKYGHPTYFKCENVKYNNGKARTWKLEEPTAKYLQEVKKLKEMHGEISFKMLNMKTRHKRSIQHEHASIFLQRKYLNKPKKLKVLLKNIQLKSCKDTLDIKWIYDLVSRMMQTHLLLSRAYKYMVYHALGDDNNICNITKNLQHVIFKLDVMFERPKKYLSWKQCLTEINDCQFYTDLFCSQMTQNKKLI